MHSKRSTVSHAIAASLACLSFNSSMQAAPAASNTLTQIVEKSCSDGSCVEAYKLKIKQISFEANKERATVSLTLIPNRDIDYPIITGEFEAQLVQGTFAGLCKIKDLPAIESILMEDGITVNPEFKNRLKNCLGELTVRTDKALGR